MKLIPAFFVCLAGIRAVAADWPGWRGANRDGIVPGAPPSSLPDKLNRKWQIAVGEGHSSPILAGGRIFDFARENDQEVLRAINPADGKVLWRQSYAAPYTMNPAATSHGPGPKATPVYSGGEVCTFGISGTLSCHDAASGKLIWRHDFKGKFPKTSPDFGAAMSPIVDRGLLIAHAGGDSNGALTAFDLKTGTEKWSWTGDGPAYASPVIAEFGGVRQLITETQHNVVGIDAGSGELLWKIGYRTNYEQNSVTPVVYGATVLISGLDNGLMALKPVRDARGWHTDRVWDNQPASMYMSTPLLEGDLAFGFAHKNKGQFVCIDARDGKSLWSSPPRQGENAAILRQGDTLFLLKNDAELIVARASSKSFEVLKRYETAGSPTWAHPLLLDDGIVVKDKTNLTFWSWR